jgi:hypothetical protein
MPQRVMSVDELKDYLAHGGAADLRGRVRGSKFNAVAVIHEGIRYHSKAEFAFKMHLDLLKAEGAIDGYTRQVPFWIPAAPVAEKYVLDYLAWGRKGNSFIEIKGRMTPDAKMKIAVVQHHYRIQIQVLPARRTYAWRP